MTSPTHWRGQVCLTTRDYFVIQWATTLQRLPLRSQCSFLCQKSVVIWIHASQKWRVQGSPLSSDVRLCHWWDAFGSSRDHAPRSLNNNFLKVLPVSKHMHTPSRSTSFASCFSFCFSWHVLVLDKYSFHGGTRLSGPRESKEMAN